MLEPKGTRETQKPLLLPPREGGGLTNLEGILGGVERLLAGDEPIHVGSRTRKHHLTGGASKWTHGRHGATLRQHGLQSIFGGAAKRTPGLGREVTALGAGFCQTANLPTHRPPPPDPYTLPELIDTPPPS